MAKVEKELLDQLTSEKIHGPFVTIMLNTNVGHQNVEKDQLKFKNFAKESKRRFEKRYPDKEWQVFQKQIDTLLGDADFWRKATKSVAFILTPEQTFIHRLSIAVDDQYYVGDTPYLLAVLKNAQYNYHYYLLALNRTSIKLYQMDNKELTEMTLPDDAPTDIKKALGEELTGGSINFRSAGNSDAAAYHGVNAKDEEVEIDWVNYYQAVDNYLRNEFENEAKWPIYLFALAENQTLFKKISKNPDFDPTIAISASPAQLTHSQIEKRTDEINKDLTTKEISTYQKLIERKNFDLLPDIKQAASIGRISHLFIATSNLAPGFGESPEEEYDWRQVLNTLADDVLHAGGEVHVLDQEDAPGQKSLIAILRY